MRWVYGAFSLGLMAYGCSGIAQDLPRLVFLSEGGSGFIDLFGVSALAGFGFLLLGAVNLLNERYGPVAPGVRRTTVAANLFLVVVCSRLAVEPGWGSEGLLVIALLVGSSAFSIAFLRGGNRGSSGRGEEAG